MKPPAAKPASAHTRAIRVVPPSGPTAWLTIFTAGAMTFLCVFALALSLASGRLATRWSEALAKTEPNGAIWANQFDNVANRQSHIETTGPEIWEQTDGKVDGFICAVGTGGTLAGKDGARKQFVVAN